VRDGGSLELLTVKKDGCNAYSAENLASIKKHSKAQYATVSSFDAKNMDAFVSRSLRDSKDIGTLTDFAVSNGITGIEIDFEDVSKWSPSEYGRYKQFLSVLGNALHAKGKKLMVDAPPISSKADEALSVWRYADFVELPVDQMVIMAYDYEYDNGADKGLAPLDWIKKVIDWASSKYPDKSRITVGIPSYGYRGTMSGETFTILTHEQMAREPGFASAKRQSQTGELTWQNGNDTYFYSDSQSMAAKLKAIRDAGITSVSVWHLGGNPWF
jgi:spore germination protein YaaH